MAGHGIALRIATVLGLEECPFSGFWIDGDR